jgi:hypothetical protein
LLLQGRGELISLSNHLKSLAPNSVGLALHRWRGWFLH